MRHTVLAIPIAAELLVPTAAPAAPPKTVELGDSSMIEDAAVPKLTVKAGGAGDMGIKVLVR